MNVERINWIRWMIWCGGFFFCCFKKWLHILWNGAMLWWNSDLFGQNTGTHDVLDVMLSGTVNNHVLITRPESSVIPLWQPHVSEKRKFYRRACKHSRQISWTSKTWNSWSLSVLELNPISSKYNLFLRKKIIVDLSFGVSICIRSVPETQDSIELSNCCH